jgi:hypothetical protein
MKNKGLVSISVIAGAVFFVMTVDRMLQAPRILSHEQLLASANAVETRLAYKLVDIPKVITEISSSDKSLVREEIAYYSVEEDGNEKFPRRIVILYDLQKNPWRTYYFNQENQIYRLVDIMNY